jgi:CheY-like chemotaxis protein
MRTEQSCTTNQNISFDAIAKPRLLLVEDNLVNQKLAARILEKMGCEVVVAGDGREALAKLASNQGAFSLVLMDCQMPVLSGYDTTREIRKSEEGSNRHVPIVAMTANAMAGDKERCLEVGMDDYVPKPIDRVFLGNVLARFLKADGADA